MLQKPLRDLEAFCVTCPAATEVTTTLKALGFTLTFQMAEVVSPESSDIPALPPQYHYSDDNGTEVVYLAGPDIPLEGECYPPHASRFWLWPGANEHAFTQTAFCLASKYHLCWLAEHPAQITKQSA